MRAFAILLVTLLLPASRAQDPPPIDLARLCAMVDAAHWPDVKSRPIAAFRSAITVESIGHEEQGQVELQVRFMEWRRPESERPRPLIRYQLVDSTRPVVRGRDRNGYWVLVGGKGEDAQGRDHRDDLEVLRRDTRLAQQLLELLDPAAVLRRLRDPSPVTDEDFRQGRKEPIPCRVVTGTLDAFPMLRSAGEDKPTRIKAYVARDTGLLLAVEAWLLDEGGKPVLPTGEMVMLDRHRLVDGLRMPMGLNHFATEDGRRRLQLKVNLNDVRLDPELTVEDFDRPR